MFLAGLTFGTSSESGLNLVPRDGPPTCGLNELLQVIALSLRAYKDYGFSRCCGRLHTIDF